MHIFMETCHNSPYLKIKVLIEYRQYYAVFYLAIHFKNNEISSVGTILLNFQFSPSFGTEASVPWVPLYRFGFAFVSFWYWFSSILVPFWPQISWNLKFWYWNLNSLEPKLLKISLYQSVIILLNLLLFYQQWKTLRNYCFFKRSY